MVAAVSLCLIRKSDGDFVVVGLIASSKLAPFDPHCVKREVPDRRKGISKSVTTTVKMCVMFFQASVM